MDVILLEHIEKLGHMGDVVRVKPGYARNYLLPQKKALRATKENRERFEAQRAQLEARNLTLRQQAEAMAKKLDGLAVVLVRQASESGQLFGSVSARDIAEAATASGFTIAHRQIRIDRPIKALGLVPVRVMLHPEVAATVTVNVAKSEEEAQVQATLSPAEAAAALFERPGSAAPESGTAPAEAKPKEKKPKSARAKEEREKKPAGGEKEKKAGDKSGKDAKAKKKGKKSDKG
jgi:large subunit ribosomal protein L9